MTPQQERFFAAEGPLVGTTDSNICIATPVIDYGLRLLRRCCKTRHVPQPRRDKHWEIVKLATRSSKICRALHTMNRCGGQTFKKLQARNSIHRLT